MDLISPVISTPLVPVFIIINCFKYFSKDQFVCSSSGCNSAGGRTSLFAVAESPGNKLIHLVGPMGVLGGCYGLCWIARGKAVGS